MEELERLESDHHTANNLHGSVEQLYSAWIASGELNSKDALQLQSDTAQLRQLYSGHIQVEEKVVFARASQMLDSQTIEAIGTEFRSRRK
jgi:hemerythrin-like domain-containing protein